MRRITASLLFLLLFQAGITQQRFFTFTSYSSDNGLANNGVNCMLQDSRGFMWFGTREGLSRFDGNGFKNFFAQKNNANSLPGNIIGSMHEFKPGHLIIATSGGLICFNTITQRFYKPEALNTSNLYYTFRLKQDLFAFNYQDSSFLVNGLLQITDTLIPPFKTKSKIISTFLLDDTTLLTGNTLEYLLYNFRTKKYTPLLDVHALNYRDNAFFFHYYDPKNKCLYFSNYFGGLYRYSISGTLLYNWKRGIGKNELTDANISFVKSKTDSVLWVGGYENGGLMMLDLRTNELTRAAHAGTSSSAISNSLTFAYTDKQKNEWIGTTSGISMLHFAASGIQNWKDVFNELNTGNTLMNINKAADGFLYLAVYANPIVFKINSRDGSVTRLNAAPFPNIWCMNSMGKELIVTGGGTTVTRYNPLTNQYRQSNFLKKYFPASDIVILALRHSNGDEWYSGNNGGGFVRISAADGSVHTYKKDGPRGQFAVSYYANYAEDENGDLWFGVNKSGRLLHWIKDKDLFMEVDFNTVKGLSRKIQSGITDVVISRDHNLWIALDGSGLLKYDPRKQVCEDYGIEDGLPTNYIYSLKFDSSNRLWIGTLKGLSCLLVDEKRFINFTKESGLPADYFDERCMYYDSSSNRLWAGSKNTLMQFDPDFLLNSKRNDLPVYIDEITVNGKKYEGEDFTSLYFSPSEDNLQIRFLGLDINNGKDIEYSYQLNHTDKDWYYAGSNQTASYSNLKPGKYVFRIRARYKGDIKWREMKDPLEFTIATPWQKTWWFKLVVIVAVALLVWYLITSYYSRKLQQQRAGLEKQKAVEQERTRISTDMHDDFGASLSRIKFLSEKLQLYNPDNPAEKTDLEKISLYSDEMAEKMNEIVWALNQRYDSLGDLVSFCRSYASEYLQDKSIKLHFSTGEVSEKKIQGEIRRNIFLVIKEALHNVVKHARATEVTLSFSQAKQLQVIIHDNGKGIDTENIRPFANGLENMKKRIADIHGQLQIENKDGTRISIQVPV
jgi:signal transduction histidine kinase/ligand-binding sensor domain-containing protein